MSSFAPKQYGLILKKPAASSLQVANKKPLKPVFGDDDDDDGNEVAGQSLLAKARSDVNKQLMAAQGNKQMDKHLKQAMEEDPNAFAYDEVYEDIQEAKAAQLGAKKDTSSTRAKPKYIANILKNAQAKKLEDDRRMERKYKKEREAEGEMFADKDAYVTEAYKKRLEEMRLADEAERMREDADGDVTKKKDMSGFYRNLLTRNVAMGASAEGGDASNAGGNPRDKDPPLPEGVVIPDREDGAMASEDRAAAVKARRAEREQSGRDGNSSASVHGGDGSSHDDEDGRDRRKEPRETSRHRSNSRDRQESSGRGERRKAEEPPAEAAAGEGVGAAKFARRNDEDRIAAARAAALARKRAGQAKAAHVRSDD